MANKKTIIKSFAAIKTIYNYFGKDADLDLMVDTWHSLLEPYTDEEVDRGVFMALRVCKYAPVPADIIEQIETFRNREKPSETELWALYQKALKEVLYHSYRLEYTYIDNTGISQGEQARSAIEGIWSGMPEELKVYVGDKSELISNAKLLNCSDPSFERTRFSKLYPVVTKRVKDKQLAIGFEKLLLEGEL